MQYDELAKVLQIEWEEVAKKDAQNKVTEEQLRFNPVLYYSSLQISLDQDKLYK